MAYCDNCDSWVSASFHRVFANPNGELDGCINCMTFSEIQKGA